MLIKRLITKSHKYSACGLTTTTGYERLDRLLFPETTIQTEKESITSKLSIARSLKVIKYFKSKPHLDEMRTYIPSEYFVPKRRLTLKHLYLFDTEVAENIVSKILPYLRQDKEQVVCETNAGLGLISSQLLNNGFNSVRLYESSYEFQQLLRHFNDLYPKRVELFVKDIYHLNIMSYVDKCDHGNRVEQLLKGVPKRNWTDNPVMTIIGPMPQLGFIRYLIRMLTLQSEIITYGRVQMFALMPPMHYLNFTATAGMSLHTYTAISVLFQLFFDCILLEKYPRKSFLPWETELKQGSRTRQHCKIDLDYIYLVRINLKKKLPTDIQHLLHLYYFINQAFIKPTSPIIPKIEKWLPGIGLNLIMTDQKSKHYPEMNIYTTFGQLTPPQLLQIFLEMTKQPEYNGSPFAALIESVLLKKETIESDLADASTPQISQNMQEI